MRLRCLLCLLGLALAAPSFAETDLHGLGPVRVHASVSSYAQSGFGMSDAWLKAQMDRLLKAGGVAIDARTTPQSTPMIVADVTSNPGATKLEVSFKEGVTIARNRAPQFATTWFRSTLYAGADPQMTRDAVIEKLGQFLRDFSAAARGH